MHMFSRNFGKRTHFGTTLVSGGIGTLAARVKTAPCEMDGGDGQPHEVMTRPV